MKTALVLEGGAMQGMYTAGVLDIFMEQGIEFDAVIGVSAGALFGINLLSGQKGRVIRYNKIFNSDKRYMGIRPLLKTGNIIDTEYAYVCVPRKMDPFDNEAFKKSTVPFYAVITSLETGQAEYVRIHDVYEQMDYLRASGSMPFVSRPVELDGKLYLDGAVADSIPFEWIRKQGYERVVVVLTKSAEYIKKPISPVLTKTCYKRKYPEFEKSLRLRHVMYNRQMRRLMELRKEGMAEVIRPSQPMYIAKTESDPEKMEQLYQLGKRDAREWLKTTGLQLV